MTAIVPTTNQLGYAVFDAELDGGEPGIRTLRGDTLPAGAVVVDALARIDVPFVTQKSGSQLPARAIPTVSVRVGERRVTPPICPGNAAWVAGRVKRSELPVTGSAVSVDEDTPITLAIESNGGGGFSRGALTVAVTYLVMP